MRTRLGVTTQGSTRWLASAAATAASTYALDAIATACGIAAVASGALDGLGTSVVVGLLGLSYVGWLAGLVPAIVQDIHTGRVLMLAWMDRESLRRTIALGETVFWSRSRREYWHKGATSGNTQRVVHMAVDCDGDTLLILVDPAGPACHTGAESCFYRVNRGT